MKNKQSKANKSLKENYPPSEPCSCGICTNFCMRPGWWTVEEAEAVIEAGYAGRMMLEISPDGKFGVLSPAFKGSEANYALRMFASKGCTFLLDGLCELHGTSFQPLECRYCHHERIGMGKKCHLEIESDWNSPKGKELVEKWVALTDFAKKAAFFKKIGAL